ncbi:MAG: S9 family peptidase [Candidatus Nanopelagicales bacterium]
MDTDIRSTPLYREVEDHFRAVLEPGFGALQHPATPAPSPDGRLVAFTGEVLHALEGRPEHRVQVAELGGSTSRQVTFGPNDDLGPAWSPDGRRLTFRSDRIARGRHQLFQLRIDAFGEAEVLTEVAGSIEYHEWSPDGRRILLGVAGLEAEQADAMGSGTVGEPEAAAAAWLPEVRSWEEAPNERRGSVLLDVASGGTLVLGDGQWNVWEATWLGDGAIAVLVSERADEGAWYDAQVRLLAVDGSVDRALLTSEVQLSYLAGSRDGATLALVEARCSDRYLTAGQLLLVDVDGGSVRRVDTRGADVTSLRWTQSGHLLVAGLRGLDSVVLDVDPDTASATERWTTQDASGDWYPLAAPLPDGRFVTTVNSSARPNALVAIERHGAETVLAAPDHAGHEVVRTAFAGTQRVAWTAADGLEIHGIVRLPNGKGPFPLVVAVHGGPVWAYQDAWPSPMTALLLARGYALFCPNPRGSGGRGRAFADMVVGDMGGADAHDILSGLDDLVARGVADPDRIGVMGGSHGGFMATWLPAIDCRFKAAVAFSPVTDWVSQHFTSSLSAWDEQFVGEAPTDPVAFGRFSPVMRFGQLRTPTLLTAGAKDRATPAGQAIEFWQALRLQGVPTQVVIYPQEGHGVSTYPAVLDFGTRIVDWFDRYLPGAQRRTPEHISTAIPATDAGRRTDRSRST